MTIAYIGLGSEQEQAKAQNQYDHSKVYRREPDRKIYNYNPVDYIQIGDVIPAEPHAGKVKLGHGKYGDQIPANRNNIKQ